MRKLTLLIFTVVILLFSAGCGSQSSSPTTASNPASTSVPVGLTVTDTPPAGVTVLFFQLSITSATLTPASGASVSLISSANPVPVNVSQLQMDSAFLSNASVAAGTYDSLSLTFANPQLTIFNASDSAISSTCAVGKVCQVTPNTTTGSSLSLTFNSSNSSAFPVTLSASSPLAFKLDIHLGTVIQSDLSLDLTATNGVTISQLPPPEPGGPIPAIGKLMGSVESAVTNNQFTLQTIEGRTFTIEVNSSTTYSGFPTSACSTEGPSCLATGQVVEVTVTLQTDATLLATAVKFVQLPTQQTVKGNIIGLSTSGGNTVMDLIIEQQPSSANATALPVGKHASVTVPSSGVNYAEDVPSTFTIPSGLTFAGASNLQVGQTVLVVVEGTVTASSGSGSSGSGGSGTSSPPGPVGAPDVSFTASSITLEPSQITGTVASAPAAGSLSFTLATLPALLVPPSPTAVPGSAPNYAAPFIITVDTTGNTTFENFTTNSISGVAVNDVVSLHGWVFATPGGATTVTVAADGVLYRGSMTSALY